MEIKSYSNLKGAKRIRAAQKDHERWVLTMIRSTLRKTGQRWRPLNGCTSVATYNAIERLAAKGKIRWERSSSPEGSGYAEV